jgi:hypothetical protein
VLNSHIFLASTVNYIGVNCNCSEASCYNKNCFHSKGHAVANTTVRYITYDAKDNAMNPIYDVADIQILAIKITRFKEILLEIG